MAGDDMPAKLVADAERAFEVEAPADVPHARRGARQRLGTRIDREPAGRTVTGFIDTFVDNGQAGTRTGDGSAQVDAAHRSEEHTSELQSLMRTSYAVFCLKK